MKSGSLEWTFGYEDGQASGGMLTREFSMRAGVLLEDIASTSPQLLLET